MDYKQYRQLFIVLFVIMAYMACFPDKNNILCYIIIGLEVLNFIRGVLRKTVQADEENKPGEETKN